MNATGEKAMTPWPLDFESPLTEWIVKHRRLLFAIVVLVHLSAINGQWRIGNDSSVYRQLGHNLVMGGIQTKPAFRAAPRIGGKFVGGASDIAVHMFV